MKMRSKRGQSIVEAVVACLILIPIVLGLFDLFVVIMCNSMHDTACKNAARAAANQPDLGSAQQAAAKSLLALHSPWINSIQIKNLLYDGTSVTCFTEISLTLPVPIPGYGSVIFEAKDVEPIVGATPAN
jgi:Flp pilus assembly protein TadG